MKHLTIVLTMIFALIAAPGMAAQHEHSGHDHAGHDHSGMAADGSMLELGTKAEKGVKAMANMKDVRAAMTKMGMKTTHHFMIMFSDEKSGKAIDSGKVAVKVTGPDGVVTGPMELMGMQGHFGADVILDKKGEYQFQVGCKLADGVTRQFEFKYEVK